MQNLICLLKRTIGMLFLLLLLSNFLRSQEMSIPSPTPNPADLTWDGESLWVVDAKEPIVYKVDTDQGEVIDRMTLINQSTGVAWDGKYLWTCTDQSTSLYLYDVARKTLADTVMINLDNIKNSDKVVLKWLAWDGEFLWASYFAGYSSRFIQIDIKTGKAINSFYSDSAPRGIAAQDEYVWSVCYNGPEKAALIDQRVMSQDPVKLFSSRKFLQQTPSQEPYGLAFDGSYFWSADASTQRIYRVQWEQ